MNLFVLRELRLITELPQTVEADEIVMTFRECQPFVPNFYSSFLEYRLLPLALRAVLSLLIRS